MKNFTGVKDVEGSDHLQEDSPNSVFVNRRVGFLVANNLLVEVFAICEVHNQTEEGVFEESLLVTDDGLMLNRGQDSHLVKGTFPFLLAEGAHLYFFEGVDAAVRKPLDLEDFGVGALACQELEPGATYRSWRAPGSP